MNATPVPTIYALASGAARGGVAVYRVSGPGARLVLQELGGLPEPPPPRLATLLKLRHPASHAPIDQAIVLWFPAPNSFTGEDVVELHMHGGRAVSVALLDALGGLPQFRLAAPGEFTRRAFENGKLDLTEAEAVADLVAAETEGQRLQALRQLDGALGQLYDGWRASLTQALAHAEAAIDFAEDDLPPDTLTRQQAIIAELAAAVAAHLFDAQRGIALREGFSVAILGAPNAGKSSLLNALARREAAIVSAVAGTTRDVIEVQLDLGGYPVILADTAGLRESVDAIEVEGVRRALARAARADIKLLVFDGAAWPQLDAATATLIDDTALCVVNKLDVLPARDQHGSQMRPDARLTAPLFVSARTGAGLPALLDRLAQIIDLRFADTGAPAPTRQRHSKALAECLTHLQRGLDAPEAALQAEDLRLALRALGRITGHVGVEDLLDIIFRDFCIGK